MIKKLLATMIVVVTLALPSACGKHLYGKDDLSTTAGKHYLDLRWGRINAAANRVHPDLRANFIQDWATRGKDVEIHDMEIIEVTVDEDGDNATITLIVNWVNNSTMTMEQSTINQKWQRTEGGWLASEDLDFSSS